MGANAAELAGLYGYSRPARLVEEAKAAAAAWWDGFEGKVAKVASPDAIYGSDMTKQGTPGKVFVQLMASALLFAYHERRAALEASALDDDEGSGEEEEAPPPPPPPAARGGAGSKPAAAPKAAAAPKPRGATRAETAEAEAIGIKVAEMRKIKAQGGGASVDDYKAAREAAAAAGEELSVVAYLAMDHSGGMGIDE